MAVYMVETHAKGWPLPAIPNSKEEYTDEVRAAASALVKASKLAVQLFSPDDLKMNLPTAEDVLSEEPVSENSHLMLRFGYVRMYGVEVPVFGWAQEFKDRRLEHIYGLMFCSTDLPCYMANESLLYIPQAVLEHYLPEALPEAAKDEKYSSPRPIGAAVNFDMDVVASYFSDTRVDDMLAYAGLIDTFVAPTVAVLDDTRGGLPLVVMGIAQGEASAVTREARLKKESFVSVSPFGEKIVHRAVMPMDVWIQFCFVMQELHKRLHPKEDEGASGD